eukprot:jgi/Bigna1/61415/fgenesh1_kg.21_\
MAEAKSEAKRKVLCSLEQHLAEKSFGENLAKSLSETARGQGGSIISDQILEDTISALIKLLPEELRKDLPAPDRDFIQGALSPMKQKRPREGCWQVDDVVELVQVVLISLAAAVDKFREIGGYVVDATKL